MRILSGINKIFSTSVIYNFAKRVYLILCSAFKETFFYKILARDLNEKSYENSFMYKTEQFFSKILVFIEKIINKILKREEKKKNPILEDIADTSLFLKAFKMNNYKEGWAFLVFALLLMLTGIMPTMVVLGLCLIVFLCAFFDLDFTS